MKVPELPARAKAPTEDDFAAAAKVLRYLATYHSETRNPVAWHALMAAWILTSEARFGRS